MELTSTTVLAAALFAIVYCSVGLSNYDMVNNSESIRRLLKEETDFREVAVQAMMRTPGWNAARQDDSESNKMITDENKGILSVNDMYIFTPREEYERLNQKYTEDPSAMPSPYHSLLSQSTIAGLNLPTKDARHNFIRPYNATQVIKTLSHFNSHGLILRYSGISDRFSIYVSRFEPWPRPVAMRARIVKDFLSRILREDHPHRFQKGQPDFSVVLSTGDSPKVKCDCMSIPSNREDSPSFLEKDILKKLSKNEEICNRYEFSPIWNFGSGFVNPETMPSVVTFTPWFHHLSCFESFRFNNKVCDQFLEHGLYFGENRSNLKDDLSSKEGSQSREDEIIAHELAQHLLAVDIAQMPTFYHLRPQIIWRGTNFSFLNCLTSGYHRYSFPPETIRRGNDADGFKAGLFRNWDTVTPRWKGVALSLDAESEARALNEAQTRTQTSGVSDFQFKENMPWIDVKFTDKHKSQKETDKWDHFRELGANVVAEHMNWKEASTYKYHIDFGGGGGTTWTGVEAKLALPGVLFHHETPTYDWFHEDLIPWVHYIPVSTELEDLKEKFEWAESHQVEAKSISDAATAFMRYMGTMEYWERAYDRTFLKRMLPTIDAYKPMETSLHLEEELADAFGNGSMSRDEESFLLLAEELGHPLKKML